jgi:glycine hydroxymethyltransferase
MKAMPDMAQRQGRNEQPDTGIELGPCANHVSARLLDIQAEPEPACRCGGAACAECQATRVAECLAVDRAKKLFGADYANVRPHSASQAIEMIRDALLQYGDVVLDIAALRAEPGKAARRHKSQSGEIDYARLRALARKHRPRIISARFPDDCRALDFALLRSVADEIEACLHIDITPVAGMIAAGLYPNPVGIADVVTAATDGSLRGPAGGMILAKSRRDLEYRIAAAVMARLPASTAASTSAGASFAAKAQAFKEALDDGFIFYQCSVLANAAAMLDVFAARGHDIVGDRNHDASFTIGLHEGETAERLAARLAQAGIHVGIDTACPAGRSGMQIGASAITTRGFRLAEAKALASLVCDLLDRPEDALTAARVRREVGRLRQRFPVPA